jgi:3-hydroxyisobutyrate dehydrogenase/2-hydroxy-3-oxopropionate reductase
MKKIGFIGVGIMGKSMVRNLIKNNYEVFVYTRTKSKISDIIQEGAIWWDTIADCVQDVHSIITMVGYPNDVEQVYFSQDGILNNAKPKAYLIDMTTTDPKLSVKIYDEAQKKDMFALDAPVSGGDIGAKNATLSIMVGGDKSVFDACMPILNCLGTTIIYEGPAGFGQHTKMANQIAISGAIASICEAITYAKTVGLNLNTMLESISGGAASSFQLKFTAPKIIKNDFSAGFYLKHYVKDLKIASEVMDNFDVYLNVLNNVLNMYETLEKNNLGELGTHALIKYYE